VDCVVWSLTGPAARYRSSVCSTPEASLSAVSRAIEQLASDIRAGMGAGCLSERIAGIWGMLADLDPGLASRRSAYEQGHSG
jgi:hypothetical protein